jgi:hypothetical protein
MPDDVLEELNLDIRASGVDGKSLHKEVLGLIQRFGPSFEVEDHMPGAPSAVSEAATGMPTMHGGRIPT